MQQTETLKKLFTLSACTALMFSVSGCGDTTYFSGSATVSPPVSARQAATLQKTVDDYFAGANPYFTRVSGAPVPGAIVAVKLSNQQPFFYARGCAEIDVNQVFDPNASSPACKTPMTIDKQFRIASITKMFVAQAVIQLEQQGLIDTTKTVEYYFPGSLNPLKGKNDLFKDKITISQLLSHTSGLYTYITTDAGLTNGIDAKPNFLMNKFVMNKGKSFWNGNLPTAEVFDFVNTYDPPLTEADANSVIKYKPYLENPYFAPGDSLHYSNTNFYLLGMLIEKVTGKKVETVIKELVTDRLNLQNTSLPTDPTKSAFNSSNFVHGYTDYYNKPFTNSLDFAILKFKPNPYSAADLASSAMYILPPYITGDGLLEDFSNADLNFLWTTGGMVTSMKDLLAFMENVIDTRVKAQDPKTGKSIELPYYKRGGDVMGYSFEYSRGLAKIGGSLIGHAGQFAGYNIASYWIAPLDAFVIVMTNKYSYNEDDGTFITMQVNDLGAANTLYKSLLYPAAPVASDPNVGLVNAIITTLANDPATASKMVGKSVDSMLLPDVSSQMR